MADLKRPSTSCDGEGFEKARTTGLATPCENGQALRGVGHQRKVSGVDALRQSDPCADAAGKYFNCDVR